MVTWSDGKREEIATPILWHPTCAICGQGPADFGIGVDLRHGKLGMWYCLAHRNGV